MCVSIFLHAYELTHKTHAQTQQHALAHAPTPLHIDNSIMILAGEYIEMGVRVCPPRTPLSHILFLNHRSYKILGNPAQS